MTCRENSEISVTKISESVCSTGVSVIYVSYFEITSCFTYVFLQFYVCLQLSLSWPCTWLAITEHFLCCASSLSVEISCVCAVSVLCAPAYSGCDVCSCALAPRTLVLNFCTVNHISHRTIYWQRWARGHNESVSGALAFRWKSLESICRTNGCHGSSKRYRCWT